MADDYIVRYRDFLDRSKTERLFVLNAREEAIKRGFTPEPEKKTLVPGDRVFFENRNKNLVLVTVGKKPVPEGFRLIASHVDSPRLDLKPLPLREESGITLLMTQYYGGIKKYQWASIPLSLIGSVILKSGKTVDISLGESSDDPAFIIPDILPHLAKKAQNDRNATEVLRGEELQVLFGTEPKDALLRKLKESYGIDEEDFLSAELELVPAYRSRELGLDRSLVGGYGQDDRICAYAALDAILDPENETPEETSIVYLADKEETGSVGATGMNSHYMEFVISELLEKTEGASSMNLLLRTLWNGKALSADVTVAFDPVFKSVHDEQNAAKLRGGIVLSKFIGGGGKMNCHDADAEYVAEIRQLLSSSGIKYQGAMFGKIDEGGGATVARYLSSKGMQVLNAGPAILGMHSPFEIAAKEDIISTSLSFQAFFRGYSST